MLVGSRLDRTQMVFSFPPFSCFISCTINNIFWGSSGSFYLKTGVLHICWERKVSTALFCWAGVRTWNGTGMAVLGIGYFDLEPERRAHSYFFFFFFTLFEGVLYITGREVLSWWQF